MEVDHAAGQLPSQLIDAGHQRLEMVAILDASVFGDFLEPLAFQPDEVHSQDGVVVIGRELGRRVADEQIEQLVHVDAGFLHHFSCNSGHEILHLVIESR